MVKNSFWNYHLKKAYKYIIKIGITKIAYSYVGLLGILTFISIPNYNITLFPFMDPFAFVSIMVTLIGAAIAVIAIAVSYDNNLYGVSTKDLLLLRKKGTYVHLRSEILILIILASLLIIQAIFSSINAIIITSASTVVIILLFWHIDSKVIFRNENFLLNIVLQVIMDDELYNSSFLKEKFNIIFHNCIKVLGISVVTTIKKLEPKYIERFVEYLIVQTETSNNYKDEEYIRILTDIIFEFIE